MGAMEHFSINQRVLYYGKSRRGGRERLRFSPAVITGGPVCANGRTLYCFKVEHEGWDRLDYAECFRVVEDK